MRKFTSTYRAIDIRIIFSSKLPIRHVPEGSKVALCSYASGVANQDTLVTRHNLFFNFLPRPVRVRELVRGLFRLNLKKMDRGYPVLQAARIDPGQIRIPYSKIPSKLLCGVNFLGIHLPWYLFCLSIYNCDRNTEPRVGGFCVNCVYLYH